ncbi:hypothetical protein HN698_07525 [Candidatus Woesearchaeota archaeon]|jgi:hypothetical protein|nr:hypothetical protein [archaeon]MBT7931731.1 hypothetical protein [Candidatus Woesearchaeota archaeon]
MKKRKFNGKVFFEDTTYSRNKKGLAQEYAKKSRARGNLSRVIKTKKGYSVFSK